MMTMMMMIIIIIIKRWIVINFVRLKGRNVLVILGCEMGRKSAYRMYYHGNQRELDSSGPIREGVTNIRKRSERERERVRVRGGGRPFDREIRNRSEVGLPQSN
jgi:hypothetical protein